MISAHDGPALGRKIVRGMFVLIFFGLFLKLGGLLMSMVMSGFYGPGRVLDAYTEVFGVLIFVFFYSSVLKVIVPAFMPLFAEEREKSGEEAAWRLANTVLNMLLIGSAIVVVLGMTFSSRIVAGLVPGFDEGTRSAAGEMLRFSFPGVMVLIFSVIALGILNSYKIFSYPSAANAAHRFAWAAVLFVMLWGLAKSNRAGAIQPVYAGFLVACVVQAGVLLFGMRKKLALYRGRFSAISGERLLKEMGIASLFAAAFAAWTAALILAERHGWIIGLDGKVQFFAMTGGTVILCAYALLLWARASRRTGIMARFAALAGPLIIGVIFARYRDLITAYFQSYTQTGVFGGLELAKTVANLPIELLPYSLSIAMFPYLCDLAARKDMGTFRDMITHTAHMIALFFVPLTVVVVIMNRPIMELVFDRGNWSDSMMGYAGTGLALYALGFFFYAVENVLMQSYFSIQRMWTPTIVGIVATLFHAAFLFVPIVLLGFNYPVEIFLVVALSFPVSRAFKNILLILLLRIWTERHAMRRSLIFAAKLCVLSAGVGLATYVTMKATRNLLHPAAARGRTVMLDTFNDEPRGWFSHDARKLSVVSETFPPAGFDGKALAVDYVWSPRRRVSVRRSLDDLRLGDVDGLRLSMFTKGRQGARYAVVLEDENSRYETVVTGDGVHQVNLPPDVARGKGNGRSALSIEDRNENWGAKPFDVTLFVDNIEFTSGATTVVVDDFEPAGQDWKSLSGEPVTVEAVPESSSPPESKPSIALATEGALVTKKHPVHLVRSLRGYQLDGMKILSFKAEATRPYALLVTYCPDNGSPVQKQIEIRKSDRREEYRVPLEPSVGTPSSATPELSFAEVATDAESGTLWLDNIALEQPTQRIKYEFSKLIVTAVPGLAALAAFIILCWLLRIAEATTVARWLLRRGWRERPE